MTIKEDVGSDDGVDNIYARELNMYENNSMGGNAYVHLLVVSKDKTTKFHFSMRVTTHFIRLKTLCCEKLGIHLNELRLTYNGQQIDDEDTPTSLDMLSDDRIEIIFEREMVVRYGHNEVHQEGNERTLPLD